MRHDFDDKMMMSSYEHIQEYLEEIVFREI